MSKLRKGGSRGRGRGRVRGRGKGRTKGKGRGQAGAPQGHAAVDLADAAARAPAARAHPAEARGQPTRTPHHAAEGAPSRVNRVHPLCI